MSKSSHPEAIRSRKRKQTDIAAWRNYQKEWARKNKPQQRRNKLWTRYRLTPEQANKMFEDQQGKCAICGASPSLDKSRALQIDHNHATGKVREILCFACNRGLGSFYDSVDLLANAITYLKRHAS